MVALRSLLALVPASFHMSKKIRKRLAPEVTTTYQLDAFAVGGIAALTKAGYTPREVEASELGAKTGPRQARTGPKLEQGWPEVAEVVAHGAKLILICHPEAAPCAPCRFLQEK